jgi:hypothetical protein
MDLFTILVYPFVFIHGKLLQFSKARAVIPLANALAIDSVLPGK